MLHVSGIYEDRGSHQSSTAKSVASSRAQTEIAPSQKRYCPPPSGTQAGMETSSMAVNTINVDVLLAASRSRNDVELTVDTLGKADSSSPSAVLHQPKDSDMSSKEGGSSMAVADLFPKTLNPVPHPEIAGAYVEGDPFLVKLQEIDRDLQKFDQVPREKVEKLGNQPNTQIFHTEGGQNGNEAIVGYTSDEKRSMLSRKNKIFEGPCDQGKVGIRPGLQKEKKKGQWIRLLNRLNSDLMEEGPLGAEGQKCKARDAQAREENNTENKKKQKTEEAVTKQCELLTPYLGSAGVAEQPRREQRISFVGTVAGLGTDRQFRSLVI